MANFPQSDAWLETIGREKYPIVGALSLGRSENNSSPLMDAPRFARNVEAAYRSIWQAWRPGQSPVRE